MTTIEKKIADLLQNKTNNGETSVSVADLQTILTASKEETSKELISRATSYVERSRKMNGEGADLLKELLENISEPVSFDWEENNAPSISADCFGDDIADAYVTKIWVENGLVKVNLHAYYASEDSHDNVLTDVCVVPDYADLIDYVLTAE